ncbi:restriction endonuclease [Streptomyces sp. NPDC001739]|uniref:restriction endonuclease n=1 Tax=Streptomyces sp. NPDC001633 TaxID=3364595 RepID=UPI0036859830
MLAEAIVAQLTERGFGDVSESRGDSVFRSDRFWIEWKEGSSSLSTSTLQRLNGIAAAEGRRLILLTTSDISRPAATFADKAHAYVFQVRQDTGELMPLNSRARETQLPGPRR